MRAWLFTTLLTLGAVPAFAAPAERPPAANRSRYFDGMGRTPAQEKQLESLSRSIESYEQESREFRHEVQQLVQRKYETRRTHLASAYEKAVRELEVLERKERLDAIAQFEEFLERYPADPKYTPDVMFRLAELYYERSSDEHLLALRDYEEALKRLDPKAAPPAEPQADFSKSVALYRILLDKFPRYALNDGAHYLLGYCLEKQNQFEESRAAYQTLIARYPKSRFATEAWMRIGEYYFDSYDEPDALAKAAQAYEAATQNVSHPLYDKAAYKLGWTYYRMDRFDEAVTRFLALADYYEAQGKARGEDEAGGDLRTEALQYAAISFSDEKWGSLEKAQQMLNARGKKNYTAEIYRRLGNVYFDQTRHPEAIAAYQLVLKTDPLAADAPQIQQKIVQAYERDRKLTESFAEAEKLAQDYAPGSPWYEKNKRVPDVVASATDLAEKSLYASAIFHHQQALVFKKDGKFDEARAGFQTAARAYGAYLSRFPRSKSAYEMQFYYAECLYNSLDFKNAAQVYSEVRDSPADTRYLAEAGFSAVIAWQEQLKVDIKAGKSPDLKPLRSTERAENEKVVAIPLSQVESQLVVASDAFLTKVPKDEKTAGVAYKTAELYYAHNDFPEARRRFEELIQRYPKSELARFSTNLIVESFLIDKDWKSVEEVSARLADNKAVIDPKSQLHQELTKFKLAGRFKMAEQLMGEGRLEEAAAKYIAVVDEEPRHEFADKALNNAAVAYEKSRRFDSALQLYERIVREYPSSKLADAALFRVAVNAENSYDFEKAVSSYERLVQDYPASKDREAALFNAARLLEGQQRYPEAAAAFIRYTSLFPQAEDAPKNQFRAALIYERQSRWQDAARAFNDFVKKFSAKPAQAELVVDAKRRTGDAYTKLGDEQEALRSFRSAADEFDKRGLKAETHPLAADAAAYSRFQLAEAEFKAFDRLKIGGKGKALERSFTAKRAGVKQVNDAYAKVFPYKRLEWTLAALYRRGHALERFASTIIETPIPPDVKRLGEEAVVAYQDLLAQQTSALEDKAVESYSATLQEARKNRISNDWTRRTLEALNRFRPKEYPVLKAPKDAIASEALYAEGLVSSVDGPQVAAEPPSSVSGGAKP